jgi:hypothetical protein
MPIKIKPGDFLEIKLAETHYVYACRLADSISVGIYNQCYALPCRDIAVLASAPVLMQLGVFSYTFKKHRWPAIGWAPIAPTWESGEPLMWKREEKDCSSGSPSERYEYFLVENERVTNQVTREQCRGLGKWAVYVPDTIEDMLRRHFGIAPDGSAVEPIHFYDQMLAE